MLVLQGRAEYNPTLKRGNATYGGNVGASAAGLVPGDKIIRVKRRRLIDVELAAQRNVLAEWEEELGSDAEEVFCVGMALDLRALHHELIYLSISKYSFETLERLARISKFQDTPKAFREDFFGIPATPENFERLLELEVPIPATHWANFVAAYEFVLRKLGMEESEIQSIIAEFVRKIATQQARVDSLCGGKYNPNQRADAQGLVSVQKALEEVFGGQLRSVIVVKE
jgi:hypothetical protein